MLTTASHQGSVSCRACPTSSDESSGGVPTSRCALVVVQVRTAVIVGYHVLCWVHIGRCYTLGPSEMPVEAIHARSRCLANAHARRCRRNLRPVRACEGDYGPDIADVDMFPSHSAAMSLQDLRGRALRWRAEGAESGRNRKMYMDAFIIQHDRLLQGLCDVLRACTRVCGAIPAPSQRFPKSARTTATIHLNGDKYRHVAVSPPPNSAAIE